VSLDSARSGPFGGGAEAVARIRPRGGHRAPAFSNFRLRLAPDVYFAWFACHSSLCLITIPAKHGFCFTVRRARIPRGSRRRSCPVRSRHGVFAFSNPGRSGLPLGPKMAGRLGHARKRPSRILAGLPLRTRGGNRARLCQGRRELPSSRDKGLRAAAEQAMPALGTVSVSSISRGGASRRTTAKLPVRNALLLRTASRRHRPILLISTSHGEEFRWTTLPPTVGIRAPLPAGTRPAPSGAKTCLAS